MNHTNAIAYWNLWENAKKPPNKQKKQTKNKNQIKKLLNLFVGFVIVGNFLEMRLCFFFSEWVRNCEWMAQNCEHSAESLALSCIFPDSSSCMFRKLISFCSSLIILLLYKRWRKLRSINVHVLCVKLLTYLLCIIIIINLALNIIMTGMSTQLILFGFLAWQILKVLMNWNRLTCC